MPSSNFFDINPSGKPRSLTNAPPPVPGPTGAGLGAPLGGQQSNPPGGQQQSKPYTVNWGTNLASLLSNNAQGANQLRDWIVSLMQGGQLPRNVGGGNTIRVGLQDLKNRLLPIATGNVQQLIQQLIQQSRGMTAPPPRQNGGANTAPPPAAGPQARGPAPAPAGAGAPIGGGAAPDFFPAQGFADQQGSIIFGGVPGESDAARIRRILSLSRLPGTAAAPDNRFTIPPGLAAFF